MKICACICELNPFHNGHEYLLRETRRLTGADYIVAVMSGDFVQRGLPAICDKYSRAKQALMGGADLVVELPVMYATASADRSLTFTCWIDIKHLMLPEAAAFGGFFVSNAVRWH